MEGLVLAVEPDTTPKQMANSVAMLSSTSPSPTSTPRRLRCARAIRARITTELEATLPAGELRPGTDAPAPSKLVETTYHGALIGWAYPP
jgi:hypothetical protein